MNILAYKMVLLGLFLLILYDLLNLLLSEDS